MESQSEKIIAKKIIADKDANCTVRLQNESLKKKKKKVRVAGIRTLTFAIPV